LNPESSFVFDDSNRYLHPQVMLRAALHCAPTNAGKVMVAKIICECDDAVDRSCDECLEDLARQICWNLLVPCSSLTFRF